MKEKETLTMKDIAQALGVSVGTVSRALKDDPRISHERRKMIQQWAKEHNFYPNAIAESLRKAKVRAPKVIGVIIPQISHYYFASILSGIEDCARTRGYNIMVAQSAEKYEREVKICDDMLRQHVCGIIVSQAKDTVKYEHFEKLIAAHVPLVFYDRICTGLNTSRVVVDDYTGAYNAVSHMIETGCRRVAFYSSPMQLEITKNRYNGYRDAILKHGLKVDDNLCFQCDNRQKAEEITPDVLAMDNRPDAFFAVNDDTAIGVLFAVKRVGLRIPDDISICGFTDGERAIECDPMLTSVEQRGMQVGNEAVDILLKHVNGEVPINKAIKRVVRTKLNVRGTTRHLNS